MSHITSGYAVEDLASGLPFGAMVRGLNRDHLKDAAIRTELVDLWLDKGVVLFRDGEDSSVMQVELSKCFGDLEQHTFKELWVEGHPELVKLKYQPADGNVYEVDGELRGGFLCWHTDLVYTDRINHGGILRPVELPDHGGQTGFIDQIDAYKRLPPALKAKIQNLHVVYVADVNQEHIRFGRPERMKLLRGSEAFLAIARREFEYPRVLHPMVYTQPGTGLGVLNVSPWFAVGVYEMAGPEGDALLHEVMGYCLDATRAYFHDWRMGDMLLWDNWRVLHSATGVRPDQTRIMQRTTIAGDYALGRKLDSSEGLPRFDV